MMTRCRPMAEHICTACLCSAYRTVKCEGKLMGLYIKLGKCLITIRDFNVLFSVFEWTNKILGRRKDVLVTPVTSLVK